MIFQLTLKKILHDIGEPNANPATLLVLTRVWHTYYSVLSVYFILVYENIHLSIFYKYV